jgi:hypothetical protein
MSSKRKWEELDDSDEDTPAYGKQILPVANLPADFNDEPMDGMQYLFMVRCVVYRSCFRGFPPDFAFHFKFTDGMQRNYPALFA